MMNTNLLIIMSEGFALEITPVMLEIVLVIVVAVWCLILFYELMTLKSQLSNFLTTVFSAVEKTGGDVSELKTTLENNFAKLGADIATVKTIVENPPKKQIRHKRHRKTSISSQPSVSIMEDAKNVQR